jgi:hypothetical protein
VFAPTPGRDYESSLKGFREMPDDEWNRLIQSLLRGGVLEVEEQRAFEVVLKERNERDLPAAVPHVEQPAWTETAYGAESA